MADWTPKENKGALQKNDYKEKETQPDFKGLLNITKETFEETGGIIKLSAWISDNKAGNPYVSLSVDTYKPKPKEEDDSNPF
jgi:hypothetical protein